MRIRHVAAITLFVSILMTACSGRGVVRERPPKPAGSLIATVWSGQPVAFDLLTGAGRQFAAYYDAYGYMTIASRALGDDRWQVKRLPSQIRWDSHNYVTLAIDSERQLHVAGNMHDGPLTYFRTTRPLDINTLTQISEMVGQAEDLVTYPRFLLGPARQFLFTYRHGRSGNGDIYFNVYDPSVKRWTRFLDAPLLAGEGRRNAYEYGPVRDRRGMYHLTWVWREFPDAAANHMLSYARSPDLTHWETSRGRSIALPITLTSGEVVDPVPVRGGLINGNTKLGFDATDRPIISYHKYDAVGLLQLFNARLEGDEWRIYQTSRWKARWKFGGGGSIPFRVKVGPVQVQRDGRLAQSYWHWKEGARMWTLDPETLQPLAHGPSPGQEVLGAICGVTSDMPGMEVRVQYGRGELAPGANRYALRWETLPLNRDRPPAVSPRATELRLYELPPHVELLGCLDRATVSGAELLWARGTP